MSEASHLPSAKQPAAAFFTTTGSEATDTIEMQPPASLSGSSKHLVFQPRDSSLESGSKEHFSSAAASSSVLGDDEDDDDYSFYGTPRFWLMFLAMCINVIVFALDQLIVIVAVPQIVDQFKALEKLAWLNTGFFIPCAAGVLIYSQLMTVWSPRWVYLSAVLIFATGCAVAGSASSMNILILGRALAGLGGAGLWNATYLILTQLTPYAKRAPIFSIIGMFYMIASVMGSLVGGAFTNDPHTGWRWCFYVNLPICGATVVLFGLFAPTIKTILPFDGRTDARPAWRKLLTIDWASAVLTVAFVTTLGIGCQWGGVSKSWGDKDVIGSFVACAVSFVLLVAWSAFRGPAAMVPLSLFKSVHFSAACWVAFFGFATSVNAAYFLSIWFQAFKNTSAIRTGVLLLAFQASIAFFLVLSSKAGETTGVAKWPMVAGAVLGCVGMGVLTTIGPSTTTAMIVGLEVVSGSGFGLILNLMTVIMQAEFAKQKNVTLHATNVFNFWGFIGRIVSMSVATNVFENKLKLALGHVKGMTPQLGALILASPKALYSNMVSDAMRPALRDIYAHAMSKVFWVCTATGICLFFACVCLKDIRINSPKPARKTKQAAGEV